MIASVQTLVLMSKYLFFCSISAQRGSASGSYSNLIIKMVLGSCFSDLNFLHYWSPSLKYPTRIRLNVRFGVYFLWTLKGVTFFLGFPHRGTRSLCACEKNPVLWMSGVGNLVGRDSHWNSVPPVRTIFFIFAFSRPSPVVGHVTHSSGELCVSLGM